LTRSETVPVPDLRPQQRLDLRVVSDDGVHALRTQLERVDPPTGRLIVDWPTEHLRLFPLKPGQLVVVEHSHTGDALYARETLLESASTEEPPRLVLRPIGQWQRIQRRLALRRPVDMRPSRATRLGRGAAAQPFNAIISDLSAGGMRLAATTELAIGDELELSFDTPSGGAELRLRVTVVRVGERRSAGHDGWDVGCQFVEASPLEREQIVQFILAQQGAAARTV
jgi:c-di-GMP-binding flagellar brake protein YcgR